MLREAIEPLSINHQGQFPAVTVSFNLAPGAALGGAITAIDKAQKDLNMPASVQYGFQGTAAAFQGSLANEGLLDSRRAGRGLYRAWRPVRKLHSSHHDSFHASIGWCGCIARPHYLQAGRTRVITDRHVKRVVALTLQE